jgi:hypothetical protein
MACAVENLDEVNIGVDFALYDVPHALRGNPILALGTLMNFQMWYRLLVSLALGQVDSQSNFRGRVYSK